MDNSGLLRSAVGGESQHRGKHDVQRYQDHADIHELLGKHQRHERRKTEQYDVECPSESGTGVAVVRVSAIVQAVH